MGKQTSEIGLGVRLSRAELRRLDELAQATGRNRNAVLRALIATTSARDGETVRNLQEKIRVLEAADVVF